MNVIADRSPPTSEGDSPLRVRIIAPSSPFLKEKLDQGIARLEQANVQVELCPHLFSAGHAYLNGSDDQRLHSLQESLQADVDVVWLARGGYGLTRLLSQLRVPENSRLPVVVGFSDATALLAWLCQRGIPCVHGPLATTLGGESETSFLRVLNILQGAQPDALRELRIAYTDAEQGEVEGKVFAANLCVLSHLVGTAHFPDLSGHIVLLEEVGERPYRIDRMLTQLLDAGAFTGVKAIVLGEMIGCEEPARGRIAPPTPLDVFLERCQNLGCPVFHQGAFGHGSPNLAIPLGIEGRLAWGQHGQEATLSFSTALYEKPDSTARARESLRGTS